MDFTYKSTERNEDLKAVQRLVYLLQQSFDCNENESKSQKIAIFMCALVQNNNNSK
jgi:hypothetical protein